MEMGTEKRLFLHSKSGQIKTWIMNICSIRWQEKTLQAEESLRQWEVLFLENIVISML
jgi:hypothetical protein